jgi:hypothetical protein
MDKHSSLLQRFVNYDRKKFYNMEPWSGLTHKHWTNLKTLPVPNALAYFVAAMKKSKDSL